MKPTFLFSMFLSLLISTVLCGCGNSDGSVSLDQNQKADLVNGLGSYSGPAHAEEIMGAMMTGVWKLTFFQDESGALKCKCTLQLHDEQNGWGSPSSAIAEVKIFKGSADGLYDLKAEGSFSDSEPPWVVSVDGISLNSGRAVSTISLLDMSGYEVKLHRE